MDSSSNKWIPSCRQLFDSALPTGAYAHSQGLEGLVQMGEVTDAGSFLEFIRNEVADTVIHSDIPVFQSAYRCIDTGTLEQITALDELATALRPTIEMRQAGEKTGRQTWRLYGQLFATGTSEQDLHARCSEFLTHFQVVVVSGLLTRLLEIPLHAALAGYAQQQVGNFAQACIKLLGFGPSAVQKIIHDLGPETLDWVQAGLNIPLENAGTMSPRWDIASSKHAYAERRLYIT